MSRGQLARTPDNFPRMKHRAAGRLAKKQATEQLQQLEDAFATFKVVGKFIGDYVEGVTNGVIAFGEAVRAAFAPPPTQADFVLIPGIPDGLLRDPEGRALVAKIHERKANAA